MECKFFKIIQENSSSSLNVHSLRKELTIYRTRNVFFAIHYRLDVSNRPAILIHPVLVVPRNVPFSSERSFGTPFHSTTRSILEDHTSFARLGNAICSTERRRKISRLCNNAIMDTHATRNVFAINTYTAE